MAELVAAVVDFCVDGVVLLDWVEGASLAVGADWLDEGSVPFVWVGT